MIKEVNKNIDQFLGFIKEETQQENDLGLCTLRQYYQDNLYEAGSIKYVNEDTIYQKLFEICEVKDYKEFIKSFIASRWMELENMMILYINNKQISILKL